MPNTTRCALVICMLAAAALAAPADKLAVTSRVETLGHGRGKLVVEFKPDSHYDFNVKPAFVVELDKAPGVEWNHTRQSPKDGRPAQGSQYYGQILPVEFLYTLTAAGPLEIRGKVTYFYCSKKDGYCARESKSVTAILRPGA